MTNNKPSRIRRAQHDKENPYFQMRRDTAQDRKLSWEARGILAYLLSQSDDWIVQIKDLQQAKCGRDKVYRILDELKQAGYLERERKQVAKGLFEWGDYLISERPFPENPYTAKPDTDKPYTENKELNKDKGLESTKKDIAPKSADVNRERNPLFDAVAQYVFGIDPLEVTSQGGRIGIIASWLAGKSDGVKHGKSKTEVGFISSPASPEHVRAFAGAYKAAYQNANMPYDLQKFVDSWRKWASQNRAKLQPPPITIVPPPEQPIENLTAEERQSLADRGFSNFLAPRQAVVNE